MANVIITNEELELIVHYLEDYACVIKGEFGTEVPPLIKLIESLEVALDRNMEIEV